jgi:phosphoribosylaminoimidazolecarboxamide formyltransferase/IMP cyclohydrolase
MPQLVPISRALISVSDKADLIPFARALSEMNVQIVSTGGTAKALESAGIAVVPVEKVTGIPEMMDGRVKTLHPSIHGAVLARRDVKSHVQAMKDHDITPIDLVCVSLYPFEQAMKSPGASREEVIEQIDIGGPAMLRSAAKNHEWVTVVTSPAQYDRLITELQANDGSTTLELRRDFAAAAFSRTAEYDATISAWMSSRRDEAFPFTLRLSYINQGELRYGENPHQRAALYSNPASAEPSVVSAQVLHGKTLSFNNLHDGAAALEAVQDLNDLFPDRAAAVIVKHTNPCGAAVAANLTAAFEAAYEGDPLAAYGGILALSQPVDEGAARVICNGKRFLEVIIAPGYDAASLHLLSERWRDVRLLGVGGLHHTGHRKINYKSVPGGMLVQERDMKLPNPNEWKHVAGPRPDEKTVEDAVLMCAVVKHLKSNAIAIGREGRLLGAGCGCVDRVTACRIAIEKSGEKLGSSHGGSGSVAASDAFFPFADGPQLLIDAGVKCIVHPGGSKRDQDTIDLCAQRDVTLFLTGTRQFRH